MRALLLLSAVTVAVGLVANAEEISPKVKKVITLGEVRRQERLSELEGGLKVMKTQYEQLKKNLSAYDYSSVVMSNGRPTSQAEMKASLEKELQKVKARAIAARNEIESIKAQKYYCPSITLKSMSVGDVGILVDPYGVQQTARITQIVNDESVIISVDSQFICLVVDTAGLKVGKRFSLTMPLEVIGTTSFKSGGTESKEIFVLEQFFFPEEESEPARTARNQPSERR